MPHRWCHFDVSARLHELISARRAALLGVVAGSAVALALIPTLPALAASVVAVPDAPLRVTAGNNIVQSEGGALPGLEVATFTDGGEGATAASFTATIDWGDGSSAETCTAFTESCTVSDGGEGTFTVYSNGHTYADEGVYTVRVLVTDADGSVSDTAIGRNSYQSSYYDQTNVPASRANDGITDGVFGDGSVAHTLDLNQNWWEVDLGASVPVSSVDVWNRTDCCGYREGNIYILASASPMSGDLQTALNAICGAPTALGASCTGAQFHSAMPDPTSTFQMNVSARYVRLQQIGNGLPINVAEVVVHGPVWLTATVKGSTTTGTPATIQAVEGVNTGSAVVATFTHPAGALAEFNANISWGDGSSDSTGIIAYDAVNSRYTVSGSHTFAAADYSSAVAADNPALYWRLGGPTPYHDYVGSNMSLVAYGGVTPGVPGATADGNGAAAFSENHLAGDPSLLPSSILGTNSRTMEVWYRSTQSGYATPAGYGCASASQAFSINLNPINGVPSIGYWLYGNDGAFPVATADDGNWHHVVLTYDGATITEYFDGASIGSNFAGTISTGACAADFGHDFVNGAWLTGGLDEIAIYPTALGATQVAAHYAARNLNGQWPVTVTITEAGGTPFTVNSSAAVADAPLTVTGSPWTAAAATDPGMQTIAVITDPGAGFPGELRAMISWGDGGSSQDAGVLVKTAGGWLVKGRHTYRREGVYAVKVAVTDDGGTPVSTSFGIGVGDGALQFLTANPSLATGFFITNQENGGWLAAFLDADPGSPDTDYSGSVNWGDGTPSCRWPSQDGPCGGGSFFGPGFVVVGGAHTYSKAGTYVITFTLHDRGGNTATGRTRVLVTSPVLALGAGTTTTVTPGVGVPFTPPPLTFRDPDGNILPGLYRVTIVWGDGATSVGSVTRSAGPGCPAEGGGCFIVTAPPHTYAYAGPYDLATIIRDSDGSVVSAHRLANVVSILV